MRHIVRDLYKRFLAVGRDYPAGLDVVRRRTKVCLEVLSTEEERERTNRLFFSSTLSVWFYARPFSLHILCET
jgi:hypothetical protein